MADRIPMSEARQWEPEGPLRKTAAGVAKGLRAAYDWASEDPLGGSKNPPLKVAADLVGLPAIANVLDALAFGDRLTTGSGQTLQAKPDVIEAAPALTAVATVPMKAAWKAAGAIAPKIAPKAGEMRMFVGPTEDQIKWAEKGEQMGKTPEEIWKTGMMFRGPDGKWRTEISDAEAKFRPDFQFKKQRGMDQQHAEITGDAYNLRELGSMQDMSKAVEKFREIHGRDPHPASFQLAESRVPTEDIATSSAKAAERAIAPISMKVADAYQHPELYSRYPEVRDLNLEMQSRKPKGYAHYSQSEGEIASKGSAALPHEEEPSILAHEIQHHIQAKHGWDPGASSSGIYAAKTSKMQNALDNMNAVDNALAVKTVMARDGISAEEALKKVIAEGNYFGEEVLSNPNVIKYVIESASQPVSELNRWKDWFKGEWSNQRNITNKLTRGVAGEMYLRNMGEAEARATQARLPLTLEQRRARFPLLDYDRPKEKLISEDKLYDRGLHFDYETIQQEMDAMKGKN